MECERVGAHVLGDVALVQRRRRTPWAIALVAAATGACAALPPTRAPGPGDTVIHVVDLGWHTDLAVLAPDAPVPAGAAPAVLLGFGARGWYMAAAPDSWDGVAALTGTEGVVLARPVPSAPETMFGPDRVVALSVSPEGMAGLRGFLRATLAAGPGAPVRLADGPYPGSAFYAAATRYGLGYTCNTWTVDALRAAGLPVSAWGVIGSGQAMRQARRAAGAMAPAP